MEIDKLYKISNTFFSILFLLILLDSFDHNLGFFLNKQFPNIYFFTFGEVTEGWKKEIWMENGLVEIMQELLLFFTICYLLYFLNKFKNKTENFIKIFLILEILGLSYFLLEEISLGQHIINYNTPKLFENINHQREFNFHNISNLFNELPKSFVFIWCGLAIPFVKFFKPKIKNIFYTIINPNNNLIKISVVLLIFTIPNLITSNLGLIDHKVLHLETGYNFKMFFTIVLSFNFFRLSELHEFIFAYYFLWHSFFLKEKIIKK